MKAILQTVTPLFAIPLGFFRYHFDSIGPALLSAMIVTTLDGWVEIFQQATNAYRVDHQPSENCNVSFPAVEQV